MQYFELSCTLKTRCNRFFIKNKTQKLYLSCKSYRAESKAFNKQRQNKSLKIK